MLDIDSLDWRLPEDRQRQNIKRISICSNEDIHQLIMPRNKQHCWHNCANVLIKLDDDILLRFLPQLLEWFKDLNWPGAEAIEERIQKIPIEVTLKDIKAAYNLALQQGDEEWAENLSASFPYLN